MKFKIQITELTKEDLVNLFSTAFYGSYVFYPYLDKEKNEGLFNENDCYEEKLADVLLNGSSIRVYDQYGEDDEDFYGKLKHGYDEGCYYVLSLKDIIKGLNKIATCKENFLLKNLHNFMNIDDGNFDQTDAENLMQFIIFGEVIYG